MYKEKNIKKEQEDLQELIIEVKNDLIGNRLNGIEKATERIVNYILKYYYIKSIRSDDKDEIWIYKEGIYIPEGKSYIEQICRDVFEVGYTTYRCNQVIAKIKVDTYINQDDFFNQQNKNPYLIPILNGILDITDLKNIDLLLHSPEYYFFNKLPIKFDNKKDCPKIKQFIKSILPKKRKDLFLTIQELFGYSMLREYKYEKAFMFEGSGANGKSKLLSLFKKFLGVENCSNVTLEVMEDPDSFQLSKLHNKLLNIAGDINNNMMKNLGIFKSLTGRDDIIANRKFKNHITFTNYAKMIFSTNKLFHNFDNSNGNNRRWVLINFPNKFKPQTEYNLYSEKEREEQNIKLQDPNIIQHIMSKDEMSGLLNFALKGLFRLEKQKEFSCKETQEEMMKKWKRKSNSCLAFIEDELEINFNSYIIKSDFRRYYYQYCKKHNSSMSSDKVIKITLNNNFGVSDERISVNGNLEHIWKGITLKTKQENNNNFNKEKFIEWLEENKEVTLEEIQKYFKYFSNNNNIKEVIEILDKLKSDGEIIEIKKNKYKVLK